ncbi:MAG: PD-(D/E)XK nuclease family protein [Oligoflexia bacterium]|nr:PD-(D/E)XK nuclease family protein [Oligoflexia bacterium]
MLNVVKLLSQSGKKKYWDLFDPTKDSWVVSDLKTKLYLKQRLLENSHIIIGEPIKRAAEFWVDIFNNVNFNYDSLPPLGVWVMAKEFLNQNQQFSWAARANAAQTLVFASKQFAILASHPESMSIFESYDKEFNQKSFFKEILKASIDFYKFCLDQKKIPHFYIPQFLYQNFNNWHEIKETKGKIFFDLSLELLETEKDIIHKLSEFTDVYVLYPEGMEEVNRAYKFLELGVAKANSLVVSGEKKDSKVKLMRCTSLASEARLACEYVNTLVNENGINPNKIVITSRDVSVYENILYHDLSWEGIKLRRKLTAPASAHSFFRELNAKLKIINQTWEYTDLIEAFGDEIEPKFKKILKPIINSEQILLKTVKEKVQKLEKLKPTKVIDFTEFAKILNKLLPSQLREEFFSKTLSILHKLRQATVDMELDYATWYELWQKASLGEDVVYAQTENSGVLLVDFRSIDEIKADYLIVLGLSIQGQKRNYATGLSQNELKFLSDCGFNFDFPVFDWSESMRWYLTGEYKEIFLSYAANDNKGVSLNPSNLWLDLAAKYNKKTDEFDFVKHSNWMWLQKNPFDDKNIFEISKLKFWSKQKTEDFKNAFTQDLALESKVQPKIGLNSISASALESYWKCPFKFLASYGFGLIDDSEFEVEPTPIVKGQILHKCAELIMQKQDLNFWTNEKLTELVDGQALNQKTVTSDVWPSTRVRIVRQLERFIDQEMQWKKLFPLSKTVGVEVKLEGFIDWDSKNKILNLNKNSKGLSFKGRIDRIDANTQGLAALIDYKDKSSGLSNIKSWAEQGNFQLALYSEAVNKEMADIKVKEVIGAFYYSLRNLEREKGFLKKDSLHEGFLPQDLPKNTCVDDLTYKNYIKQIFTQAGECLEKISAYEYTPKPQKESLCESCSWSQLCRAKHLL